MSGAASEPGLRYSVSIGWPNERVRTSPLRLWVSYDTRENGKIRAREDVVT